MKIRFQLGSTFNLLARQSIYNVLPTSKSSISSNTDFVFISPISTLFCRMSKSIEIYYGSQTGNTLELAQRIFFLFRTRGATVSIGPLGNILESGRSEDDSLKVICVSTTGQGTGRQCT